MKSYVDYKKYCTMSQMMCKNITDYYVELHKKNEEKDINEITKDLMICKDTLWRYFKGVDLTPNGDKYSKLATLVLLHTKFPRSSKYFSHKEEVIRRMKKLELHQMLNEVKMLRMRNKAREDLVNVLTLVSNVKR